jgi:hypothetical protein
MENETESGPSPPPLPPPPLLHNMLHADFVTLIRHMLVASVYKTVDYEKHMRVSKPSRIFEAGPPSYRVIFKRRYESLLIQCTLVINIHVGKNIVVGGLPIMFKALLYNKLTIIKLYFPKRKLNS